MDIILIIFLLADNFEKSEQKNHLCIQQYCLNYHGYNNYNIYIYKFLLQNVNCVQSLKL